MADAQLVAAIGPDSVWLTLTIGQLFKTDRLDVAGRTVAIALAEARRRGSAPGFAGASAWRAWIALREGAAAEAEADARAAYDAPSGTPWKHVIASCPAWLTCWSSAPSWMRPFAGDPHRMQRRGRDRRRAPPLDPGHAIVLAHLGLQPLLDLELRLGEGSGAALALPLLGAALAILDEMATFASAGVDDSGR